MKKLGKYEVLEQIGQGAMGTVYKALDPFIERIVAVKTILADLDADPELKSRFFREARSAGQLSHKNIVTIYELGEEGGKAYMAMEFLDGADIKHKIARGERIPLEDRLRYMIEVVEGLSHAHKKGVFHRDIKPGNIYITNAGQVKILDFGLARIASSDMTKTGSVMGTPNYMSPEQIQGLQIDNRSDIFSAGATFYELLSYRKPFDSTSLQSTFFKILQEAPEPLETIDPSIPPEFSTVVLRAMAKNPADRYQNADEMLQVLERLEKTLEQRKRKVKEEARQAVEILDRLITQNAELLGGELLQSELSELKARILIPSTVGEDEDTARTQNVEAGFLEILKIRDTAKREHQRLEVLLQKQQAAVSLLRQAASLEQEGQLEKALELVEKVVTDLPQNAGAAASSRRIQKTLSDRAQAEARDAVEKFEQLINQNQELLEAEDHFSPSDLKAGLLLASIGGRSNDQDATIPAGPPKDHAEILQIRDRARDERERLETVIAERKKIALRLQEAAKHEQAGKFEDALRLAQEILNEIPTHSEAHALVDRVRETLATRARDEEKKRHVVRLLRQSRQLHGEKKLVESLRSLDEALTLDQRNTEALTFHRQVSAEIQDEKRKQERAAKAAELFQRASTQSSAGDLAAARSSLVEALVQDPNHSGAANLLADVERQIQEQADRAEKKKKVEAAVVSARKSFEAGDLTQARREVERALGIDPEWTAAKETFRKIVQAEEELRSLKERQRQVQSLLQESTSLLQSGDDEAAAAKVNALLELDPQHVPGVELRKKIAERREARERAIREKREKIAKTLVQALAAESAGDLDKARELAKLVLKEEAAHVEAQELLERIEELRARKARLELERKVSDLLVRADELAKRQDYQGAVSLLEKADTDVASEDSVKRNLKRHREAARAEQQAREQAEREAAEKESRELLSLAERLAARGNHREAVSILEAAKPLVASLPSVKQGIEQYRKAAQAQEEARERSRQIQEHLERGKKSFGRQDFAACEREMDQILAMEPGNTEASEFRAQAREQLRKQRDEERRLKELADSLGAAQQCLKIDNLEAARGHVLRAQALDSNNADAARLQAQIEKREAELRAEQQRKQRSQELVAEAQSTLEKGDPDRAGAVLAEAMALGVELPGAAALQKRIDKQKRRLAKKPPVGVPLAAPSASGMVLPQKARVPRAAIWLGVLVVVVGIGLGVWALVPGKPQYEQQVASARSYIEQKQFDKAVEALQQIPSNSPLYAQAQDLINEARNGDKQKNIDALLAEAANLRKQGQNEKSLITAGKVLEIDASNQAAKSLRDEIERENYQSKTQAEREQYMNAALARAEELLKSGDLEAARAKTDEVMLLRPNDTKAANLRVRIVTQIETANKATAERSKLAQAKASAEGAKAPELAQARFAAAQRAEEEALRQQNARQIDQAAKTFSDAAALYGESEKAARAESQARADRERESQQRTAAAQDAAARAAQDAAAKAAQDAAARAAQDAAARAAQDTAARAAQASQQAAQAQAAQAQADRNRQAAEAARREESERQAIRDALDGYKTAYEARNIAGIRTVFPSINGREEAGHLSNFDIARSIQMQLAEREIQISGETARAAYQQQIEIRTKDNKTLRPPQASIVFNLGKRGGSWIILGINR